MPVGLSIAARGAVQGVGFRPFVFGLATELGLRGYVRNSAQGAEIEIEGDEARIEEFLRRLSAELPCPAHLTGLETVAQPPRGLGHFEILHSEESGPKLAVMLPDIATCPRCLAEMRDPEDRRYRYPFINCTHCGPRYSILRGLPYDRPKTTMAGFAMCPACRREYGEPSDRRFHAQPIACPVCGPQIELWSPGGQVLARREEALSRAVEVLRGDGILALKGIGGFHLMVDARDEQAVRRLRERKRRYAKPLAVMAPSLEMARSLARISDSEARLLAGPEAPIVLVAAIPGSLAESVAPENPNLGLMLPYSPLHHLLLGEVGFPLVATSGNLSEEPICVDEREALARFADIADALLVHDRPIARPVDDSVVRVMTGRTVVLRRARGYAPLPIPLPGIPAGLLAAGGHMKNSVAVSLAGSAVVGQHVGDLDTAPSRVRMEEEARDVAALYDLEIEGVIHDLHPDYASTRFALSLGKPAQAIQHHVAHAFACLAENGIDEALAVVWDGTGYGTDGTIWGGEFFRVEGGSVERIGRLRRFLLPGGEAAVREGRRAALGLLREAYGPNWPAGFGEWAKGAFEPSALRSLRRLLATGSHCVTTSSMGRLFDGFAALGAGILESRFEGDAAMRFEHLARGDGAYPFPLKEAEGLWELDWAPALAALLDDRDAGVMSARFHAGLAEAIVAIAERTGLEAVALSGGCFQNRLLLESAWDRLEAAGFRPVGHQRIPPNDGGIAFGQLAAVAWE
ncbi:MAG TPA: carbamoyltransferase HypF [Fimbriimonadaceae bacterium]|nr:carbamoyltransferase HypF [Fimbriimonadaceae bacterium]